MFKHDAEMLRGALVEVRRYQQGSQAFFGLVGVLDAAITGLSSAESSLKQALHEIWWELEQINALALFVDKDPPLDEHRAEVETLLQGVVQLVEAELSSRA